jgi:hypothetical protein
MPRRTDISKILIIGNSPIAVCSVLLVTMLSGQMLAQDPPAWRVDRFCGQLEQVQRIPSRKGKADAKEKRKALRDISLSLYERHENELCCSGLNAIATSQTQKNGQFVFKNQKPGNYWLRANWGGKDYTTAVVFQPLKDSITSCSGQGLRIDDQGNPGWWSTITLD